MTPPLSCSWRALRRGLVHPGRPPSALPGTAFILMALSVAAVALDFLHGSKTLEDGMKIIAGTLILVGVLAAWLQLVTPGDPA
jgi:hypothetical protein